MGKWEREREWASGEGGGRHPGGGHGMEVEVVLW